ncbi:hypothetical protein [Flavobacterium sp.]|uniref:hypothetical protein n=1 Tax=Flavobacterium sp. TaxID=239 RepID=UPI002637411A|nr:hypothetical protein [Flavobacterium sp.]
MIKKIIVSISLFLSVVAFAQESTSSPYSFYGLGDVRFKGTIENRAMGGLSVLGDSIHINLQNPALQSNLKLTTFAIGGTYSPTTLKTDSEKEKSRRTGLDYLAVAIPLNKMAFSLGLIPYSSVGYKIRTTEVDPATDEITQLNDYSGEGGINKVFLGYSYQLTSKFSVGADLQYNFGRIETKSLTYRDEVQFGTRELNTSDVSGVNFNTGIGFNSKLNKKLTIFSGITFSPKSTLKLNNERSIATVQFSSVGGEVAIDEAENIDVDDSTLTFPSKLAFSTAIGEVKKWSIGGEVTLQGTSDLGSRFNDIDNVAYENSVKYSIGGYYIPKYNSFTNYFNKIVYRGGFRYENTGLVLNNESIKDYALTLGLGLPLGGTFSNINIGLEFGKRGTTNAGLVQENYTNISIGLSFNDKWFKKAKYD